jgi:hypothetical protein
MLIAKPHGVVLRQVAGSLLSAAFGAINANASEAQRTDCILVRQAQIASKPAYFGKRWSSRTEYRTALRMLNEGHEIGEGKGHVFALRSYDENPEQIDTQSFTKLTIDLGKSFQFDNPIDLRGKTSYYLSGYEAQLTKGFARYSDKILGVVTVRREPGGLTASVKAHALVGHVNEPTDEIKREINFKCNVTEKEPAALTPWEGEVGATSNLFIPPRPSRQPR